MSEPIRHRRWAIAEGYIPGWSNGPEPQFTSHETACLLNTSDEEAYVEITIYFSDRDPVGRYRLMVAPRRTLHLRFNELHDPDPIHNGHRLRERDRGGCADSRAAHPPGLAPGRERAALHHSVCQQRVGRFLSA